MPIEPIGRSIEVHHSIMIREIFRVENLINRNIPKRESELGNPQSLVSTDGSIQRRTRLDKQRQLPVIRAYANGSEICGEGSPLFSFLSHHPNVKIGRLMKMRFHWPV